MKWQVKYALQNFNDTSGRSQAEYVEKDLIKIETEQQPDVLALISDAYSISKAVAEKYVKDNPDIDFICGYRKDCIWEGDAIYFLEGENIGWGNFGTLHSAAREGNANFAEHKVFAFAARLIHQYGIVKQAVREFDRVFRVELKNGRKIKVGLIPDYEPTADNVRNLWDKFGPLDIAWNFNPNGEPTSAAKAVGDELGCKVVKTEGIKKYLTTL
ncbi:hypothetical protein [Photobacterium sanguinicancri]|uniref:Restriction endonuclease n=1 Tax=Photobacterium sanguinicancri TaxID=875932 RepID=A0AAW7Y3F5_9GAMM|nr:hypothetical protein [Photobacterium sanguinicancri]MDO6542555.1 hypothetical protein [Photobacterium sanguinicancri]